MVLASSIREHDTGKVFLDRENKLGLKPGCFIY